MADLPAATFTGLVDLASATLGGKALATSDDFFAGMENLLKAGRGVFIEGKYTDRGKWMDGWESRRKRSAGYDYCLIELGAPGWVQGFDIDTNHFLGNHPPYASVEGVWAEPGTRPEQVMQMAFAELLPQVPLRPGSQNLFAAERGEPVTHVRLNIFPDGGVARFRVYGKVRPRFDDVRPRDAITQSRVDPELVDLAALENGAWRWLVRMRFSGP